MKHIILFIIIHVSSFILGAGGQAVQTDKTVYQAAHTAATVLHNHLHLLIFFVYFDFGNNPGREEKGDGKKNNEKGK